MDRNESMLSITFYLYSIKTRIKTGVASPEAVVRNLFYLYSIKTRIKTLLL